MDAYQIITLIISALSLVSSIFVSFSIHFMGNKSITNRYKLDVETSARKFIIDHGDGEILYLPYCIFSSGVNRHHKHIRAIYNDFDALPNDVQKEVLRLAGYDYELIQGGEWVDKGLKEIEEFSESYDFGDTFLYDGAKYLYRAFSKHSSALVSSYNELEDLYDDELGWIPEGAKQFYPSGKINFSQYLESYYQAFVLGNNEKKIGKQEVTKPLTYLKNVKNFYYCTEEELCFWIMVSVREMASCVERTRHKGDLEQTEAPGVISRGDALPKTFEDMYYETLMQLYNLKLDEEAGNKRKEK